eukprot:2393432-Rhodomonas_salina.2
MLSRRKCPPHCAITSTRLLRNVRYGHSVCCYDTAYGMVVLHGETNRLLGMKSTVFLVRTVLTNQLRAFVSGSGVMGLQRMLSMICQGDRAQVTSPLPPYPLPTRFPVLT